VNKKIFIQAYIDIESKTFNKSDKVKKFEQLFNDYQDYKDEFSWNEIIELTDYLTKQNITIQQPLFRNLIYPILSGQVSENNLQAIKTLLRLEKQLLSYQGYSKDTKYLSSILLAKGMSIDPDDRELLEISEKIKRDYLHNTNHEIPSGVLFETNGATLNECDELINEVNNYEIICSKLRRNKSDLISKCKYFYQAYKDYLQDYKSYNGFADFLTKKSEKQG
jgi:hypothetical protein